MGQSSTKHVVEKPIQNTSSVSTSTIASHTFSPKKYFTRIELVSLKYVFEELKSTFPDGFTCIEPKKFLELLNLPSEVEPAGVLLFKSFSYLGSYPSCSAVGPVPLSFNAFITAYAILVGKLDEKPDNMVSENLFFQSLSILPSPTTKEEQLQEDEVEQKGESVTVEEPATVITTDDNSSNTNLSKGLSLADLGVDFSDMDFDTTESKSDDDDNDEGQNLEILCRDLVELFVLLLWLGEADQKSHDFKLIREMANSIVDNIKPILTPEENQAKDDDLPCVSHRLFCQWKEKFSPHLFKPIQSLVTKTFGYFTPGQAVKPHNESRLLPEDKVPTADITDILTPLYSTLLSWSLPEDVLITKKWIRLYSADLDGFSMNRFESHVFKYPGPTLFVMQVDAVVSTQASLGRTPPRQRTWSTSSSQDIAKHQSMTIGAYITQPWKHSKQFWGTSECFLFELDPNFDVFRPIINKHTGEANNSHYIYYHHDFGIGFGPTDGHLPQLQQQQLSPSGNTQYEHHSFILWLQNTLQGGIYEHEAYPSKPSFESATKSRKHASFFYKFDTENIEVFGLGNEKDREKQAKEWKFEKQEADRRAGLNIRTTDGQLDKELLKMAGIIDEDKRQDR